MCFSATASFTAGIVLTGIGVMTLRKVKKPSYYCFALIPLIFAVQQLIEGVVWLSFTNADMMQYRQVATYGFLFFAENLWPFWVPLSILLMEENPTKKKILKVITVLGLLLSVYLLFCMFNYELHAEVCSHHIFYNLDFPLEVNIYGAMVYYLSTVIAPILSSNRKVQWFGFGVLLAYVAARLFFEISRISVWCFFAAVVSIGIYFIIRASKSEAIKK